ncbi:MAG: manganese catalase family protein [Clostridiaceae bacterium]|jgi:bacterioferritin|nr:manganese catalase family protein [Clostridiaceae bacterium]
MENSKLKLSSDLPYPEIDEVEQPTEAKKLMNDYAGRGGEYTAIAQYIFQSFIKYDDAEISNTLRRIAMVEMHHLSYLGTAIAKLGGYPVFGGVNYPWNGTFVNYAGDPSRLLLLDIKTEEEAIYNYEKTLLVLKNEQVKRLIERIILDEEIHIKVLTSLLDRL